MTILWHICDIYEDSLYFFLYEYKAIAHFLEYIAVSNPTHTTMQVDKARQHTTERLLRLFNLHMDFTKIEIATKLSINVVTFPKETTFASLGTPMIPGRCQNITLSLLGQYTRYARDKADDIQLFIDQNSTTAGEDQVIEIHMLMNYMNASIPIIATQFEEFPANTNLD